MLSSGCDAQKMAQVEPLPFLLSDLIKAICCGFRYPLRATGGVIKISPEDSRQEMLPSIPAINPLLCSNLPISQMASRCSFSSWLKLLFLAKYKLVLAPSNCQGNFLCAVSFNIYDCQNRYHRQNSHNSQRKNQIPLTREVHFAIL